VLTPERLKATRLGYEAGMRVGDLAVLNGRSQAWVHRLVREQEWTRMPAAEHVAPPTARPEIAAIEAALLGDRLDRDELIPLVERAVAVAAADGLTGRDQNGEARVAWLTRAATIVKTLPAREARPADGDRGHADGIAPFTFIETSRLIEEIAERYEAFCRSGLPADLPAAADAPVN
jgi:hypothetical protein